MFRQNTSAYVPHVLTQESSQLGYIYNQAEHTMITIYKMDLNMNLRSNPSPWFK